MERMIDAMMRASGLNRETLLDRRNYPAPDCRAMMYREMVQEGMSHSVIGRAFNRNHSSITCALRHLEDHLTYNAELRDIYSRFTAMI